MRVSDLFSPPVSSHCYLLFIVFHMMTRTPLKMLSRSPCQHFILTLTKWASPLGLMSQMVMRNNGCSQAGFLLHSQLFLAPSVLYLPSVQAVCMFVHMSLLYLHYAFHPVSRLLLSPFFSICNIISIIRELYSIIQCTLILLNSPLPLSSKIHSHPFPLNLVIFFTWSPHGVQFMLLIYTCVYGRLARDHILKEKQLISSEAINCQQVLSQD